MHVLPPLGHAARELFAVADLAAYGLGAVPPMVIEARAAARNLFAGEPAIRRVAYIVLLADDRLALISFGRRLAMKRHWIFGPWKAAR